METLTTRVFYILRRVTIFRVLRSM
jgi:hypothetical protein